MIQRMFVTIDTKKTNYKNVGKINHGDDLILELTVLSYGNVISFKDPMVDLLVKKSDGKMIRQNSGIEHIKPNKFIIEVNKDCVTSPGLSTNQLIINDNGRISTCMFYYTILNSLEEDIIESISNVEVLEQLDEFTIQMKDKMENFDEELQNRMSELEDAIDDLVEFFGDTSVDLLEAELSRNEAEQSRAQAESVRVQNESRRIQNDLDLANAEAERVRAENIRIQNEADRALVDAVMDQKESKREDSELERIQNESKRATDEVVRQQNENTRQSNESIRMSNETDRKTQENRRVTAETNRVNAETTRRNNENSRISNETERQKTIKEMKSLLEDARWFDNRVGVIEDEIEEINSSLDNIAILPDEEIGDIDSLEKAISEIKKRGGNRLYLPAKTYIIDRPLIISNLGIDIQAVPYRTKIQPSDNFKGDEIIRFEQNEENLYKGVNIEGLYIDCKGKECNGITFISVYDQFSLRNVEVRNCNDDFIAFNFAQNNDRVGQTLLIENCIGDHISNTSTKPVWYFNRYQEVNMVGTKAFGSKANNSPNGTGYYFVDCKGITMTGCSHSFCENGIVIEAKNRHCNGFNLIAPNHEEVGNNSIKTISHESYLIGGLNVFGIRDQNGIGKINLSGVRNSTLFTTYSEVNIDNTCTNIMIISGDKSKVSDSGKNTTIIGSNNALQETAEISKGLGLINENTPMLDFKIKDNNKKIRVKYSATKEADYGYIVENTDENNSTVTLMKLLRNYSSLYANNIETLRATTTGLNMTGLMVLANLNGVDKLVKVQIGDVDSGGSGFRVLRIPNTI